MSRRLHVWSPHLLAAAEVKLIAVSFRSKDANQVSYFQILPCNPPRALSPRSVRLRRDQIHAAVTALVESGVKSSAIRSLADLVTPDHLKRILRRRLDS